MDPQATLKLALDSILYGNVDDAHEALQNYWQWRQKGGFEPDVSLELKGDALAEALQRCMHGAEAMELLG